MAKSSKKRERTDEDVADNHDAKPAVKKSKLDSNGKAEVTKKSSKVKEVKAETVTAEEPAKSKKEKKDKKEKKEKKDKSEKKEKKEKKEKRKAKEAEEPSAESDEPAPSVPEPAAAEAVNGDASTDEKRSKKKKDKKDKKDKKSKKSKPTTEPAPKPESDADAEPNPEDTTTTDAAAADNTNSKQTRFICFVGNLPYTATADSVRAHFATLHPTSVRLLTHRDQPTKSRGIAFVEFAGYDHMKTCLAKFHHTEFDDGKSAPRRINVELTAGGGGKTAARQDKIKQKNAKLNEERANRMQREEEAKLEKAANGKDKPAAAAGGKTQQERDEESIHPSRRARVPYGKQW